MEIVETWDAMGMRATGSHDIIFHDTFVPEAALLYRHHPNGVNRFLADGRVYSLEIPAVYLEWQEQQEIMQLILPKIRIHIA